MSQVRILAGGEVIDGTGSTRRPADVWLEGALIADVRSPAEGHPPGAEVVDCSGQTIAPGFIDVHSHGDVAGLLDFADTSKILQGVTTEVVGNCGFSYAPRARQFADLLDQVVDLMLPGVAWRGQSFDDYWTAAEAHGLVTNAAPLVGHGALRISAMGMEDRPATAQELSRMRDFLAEALDAGAFGFSTGLIYPPGVYASTEEIIDLARLLGRRLYATHMRGESDTLEQSVAEAIAIGAAAGVQVQISHHKAAGRANWGRTARTLEMIDEARARGQNVRVDVYPYTASSTDLSACLPPWAQAGGPTAMLERLKSTAALGAMRRDIEQGIPGWENLFAAAGPGAVRIAFSGDHRFEGQTLAEIAQVLGMDAIDALFEVLRRESLRVSMILFWLDESDVQRVIAYRWSMIGSDGGPGGFGGKPHPRAFGTFPRTLGRYVSELGLLTLEQAVHKMTGLSAETFQVPQRGILAPGMTADIVVFDAGKIRDGATFEEPETPPVGISRVYLAGDLVVSGQQYVGQRHGRRLRPAEE